MIIKKIACASTLTLTGSLIGLTSFAPVAEAVTPIASSSVSVVQIKEDNSETLRQGLPGRRLGGGTRSERIFSENYVYLTALVTADNLSATTAEHPSLMFYVPEMVQDQTAEFVLRNADDELVYETSLQVNQTGGMISIETSEAGIEPLNIHENYTWYFSIVPDAMDRANDVVVYGNLQRVNSEDWMMEQTLQAASIEQENTEALLTYAQRLRQDAALWHDAAYIVGALHQDNPQNADVAAEWSTLLKVAGLDAIVEPIASESAEISINAGLH
ncbi:MAG: DUF928 domain-containing protein [Cyanobacteria bacterium J06650_10]